MNADAIVTIYVVIDDMLQAMQISQDSRARLTTSEILTVAVVSAQQFQNHHERALSVLHQTGYIGRFSRSRFNRCLHALNAVLALVLEAFTQLLAEGDIFIIDTLPIPVCKRARARRCRKLHGRDFYGYCASKDEHFFGWQLHLVGDAHGIPVSFDLLPACWDERVPVQSLLVD